MPDTVQSSLDDLRQALGRPEGVEIVTVVLYASGPPGLSAVDRLRQSEELLPRGYPSLHAFQYGLSAIKRRARIFSILLAVYRTEGADASLPSSELRGLSDPLL